MQGSPQHNSIIDAARNFYLDFKFFDGVMVDCSDMGRSQSSASSSSSALCDKSSIISPADEILGKTSGTGVEDVVRNSIPKQKVQEDTMPRTIVFPNRNAPCMSSLGIHMCDCEDDSLDCNLVTCMASPLDGRNSKTKDTFRAMKTPDGKDICGNEEATFWWSSGEKHGNLCGLKAETPSPGTDEGFGQNSRASESDFGGKSALAAWAALVSDAPHHSSLPMTGSVERISTKRTLRAANDRKRVPTLASHLEHTENALSHFEFRHDFGENVDIFSPVPSASLQAASTITNSPLKREFTRLKLDPGRLSISDPASYGTLHGLVHCTFKNSLPSYTFLLDDYEEVITAKIWMKDAARQKERGSWRYSFYSLQGETKRKGKSGWKHWRKNDKLGATLLGKMKISSTLCAGEKRKLSVKSECILFSARLNEPAAEAGAAVSTQGSSSSLFKTEPLGCKDAACTVCSVPSNTPASLTTSWDVLSHMLSPIAAATLQRSPPHQLAGIDITQRSKPMISKWNIGLGLPSMGNIKARTSNASQTLGVTTSNGSAHGKEFLPGTSISSTDPRHSELAAIIVDVPLEIQDRSLINEQASITVILPSGNHGRPLCDLRGPSPLISRWKAGGKCDCKGWDLGCGLMVLCNSSKKPNRCSANEGGKLQRNEDASESRPLKLYKQDGDQDDAILSLTAQGNGLVALDFCAPLSPLQAFAMAVAILHGRDSNDVLDIDAHERKLQTLGDQSSFCQNDWDGLCVDTSNIKEMVNILVNSNQPTSQPQDNLDISILKAQGKRSVLHRASELALSFERV